MGSFLQLIWRMVPFGLLLASGLFMYLLTYELRRLTASNDAMIAVVLDQEDELRRMRADPDCWKGAGSTLARAPR